MHALQIRNGTEMHAAIVCLEQKSPSGFTLYWAAVSQSITRPHYRSFCCFESIQSLAASDILCFADNIWNSYLLEGIIKLS